MIKVEKGEASRYLQSGRVKNAFKLMKEFYSSSGREQKRYTFPYNKEIDILLKQELHEKFHGKCGYCEITIPSPDHGTIDRFRPYNGVRDKKEYYPDLYWWLNFKWNNLVYCCKECNQYKANYFPIAGIRALDKNYDLNAEEKLLVDPCNDEPSEHFSYDNNGYIISKTDQGEQTIQLLRLNRINLIRERRNARLEVITAKDRNAKLTKSQAEQKAKAFIQNIHHFRDESLKDITKAPIEKVVVFDEAQRAWQKEQVSKFMGKRGKQLDKSEPEFLISVMDRHQDWCTIICLVGGGQEINTGEAGVSEWIESLKNKYPDWDIYYSDKILKDSVYLNDTALASWLQQQGNKNEDLHLAVSVRSFRSEQVSQLVHCILDNSPQQAKEIYSEIKQRYPIYLTRNLDTAKQWLRAQAKGTERIGIIASSGGKRLKPDGIDVKNEIKPPQWFLNDSADVRSSYYLEDVATEFEIQGLEIDYSCLAWDINLYYDGEWKYKNFKGSKWLNINNEYARKYLLNAYRVLLTRARQGMIIYIPEVDGSDWTRPRERYEDTFRYLVGCGLEVV